MTAMFSNNVRGACAQPNLSGADTYSKHYGQGGYTREEAAEKALKIFEAQGVWPKEIPDSRGGVILVVER